MPRGWSYADTLVENALLLRMYGDIDHMPMSQREWDVAAEQYLRNISDKGKEE